ncbi:MAG: hypothetical protein AAF483_09470 [Planctomycetota bacterium]
MKAASFVLLAALVCLVGCGAPTSTVTGTVNVDGTATGGLIVAFTPIGGGTGSAATTDASGKYTVKASPGKYNVSITTEKTVDDTADPVDEDNAPYDENSGSGSESYEDAARGEDYAGAGDFKETIPAKYNTQTELTATLAAGESTQDFDLKTE